jgi:hypothetical protein
MVYMRLHAQNTKNTYSGLPLFASPSLAKNTSFLAFSGSGTAKADEFEGGAEEPNELGESL